MLRKSVCRHLRVFADHVAFSAEESAFRGLAWMPCPRAVDMVVLLSFGIGAGAELLPHSEHALWEAARYARSSAQRDPGPRGPVLGRSLRCTTRG